MQLFPEGKPVTDSLDGLLRADAVCVDIETDTKWRGIGPDTDDYGKSYVADITHIAFCWKMGSAYRSSVMSAPYTPEELAVVREVLIGKPSRVIIAHNAGFDLRQLGKYTDNQAPLTVWDTLAMAMILHPETCERFSLIHVARALDVPVTDAYAGMKGKRSKLHELPVEQVREYARADVITTFQVYEAQQALILDVDTAVLVDWEMRASSAYAGMNARGVHLNIPYVKQRILELHDVVQDATAALAADGLTEPNKPMQRAIYLYGTKGIPLPEYGRFSPFWTDKAKDLVQAALKSNRAITIVVSHEQKVAKRQRKLTETPLFTDVPEVKMFGSVTVGQGKPTATVTLPVSCLSTGKAVMKAYIGFWDEPDGDDEEEEDTAPEGLYVEQLRALANYATSARMLSVLSRYMEHAALDGRVHSIVAVATKTGRRSSQAPNLQNQIMAARKDDPAGDMCGVLIAPEGFTLVEKDLSNAENKGAAVVSGDDALAEATESQDFHAFKAARFFGDAFTKLEPKSDEWDRLRSMSKGLTFGGNYGMGPNAMSFRLGCSLARAKELMEADKRAYPLQARAKEDIQVAARQRGFIRLWTGRKVMVDPNRAYKAWNYACQGWVGEMVKRAIVQITEIYRDRGMQSYVALDMHDAVILAVKHEEWDAALAIAKTALESVVPQHFNARTEPNIRWIAETDPKKNAKKWGKFQLHPPFPDTVMPSIAGEGASQPEGSPPTPDADTPERASDLKTDKTAALKAVLARTLDTANQVERDLEQTFRVMVPQDVNGQIVMDGPHEVSFTNWTKIPLLWLQQKDRCDLGELLGFTPEELLNEYHRRKALVETKTAAITRLYNLIATLQEKGITL